METPSEIKRALKPSVPFWKWPAVRAETLRKIDEHNSTANASGLPLLRPEQIRVILEVTRHGDSRVLTVPSPESPLLLHDPIDFRPADKVHPLD